MEETICEIRVKLIEALALANMLEQKIDRDFLMPEIESCIERAETIAVSEIFYIDEDD